MKDRIPKNPGRVLITPEDGGAAYYATVTRADNPTQAGDPLNKNTLLKDSTAALLGLGADAVPDDLFAFLGKYNLHCWKKRFYGAHYAAEAVETPTAYTIFITTSTQHNFYYADSITVSQTDGKISLNNPSVFSFYDVSSNGLSNAVKGKYFSNSDGKYTNLSEVYKFGNNLTGSTKGGEGGQYYTFNGDIQRLVGTLVEETSDWECVFSQDSNAYPKDVVVDGIEYLYCGIPFDNAVNAAKALKLIAGMYVGDATATRIIKLGVTPKLVFVAMYGAITFSDGYFYGGIAAQDYSTHAVAVVEGGFQLTHKSAIPSNNKNTEYTYFALY